MITIKPFKALRPEAQLAKGVASRPYDVLNSKEAKLEAMGNPNSFLHITKSEIDLPDTVDIHSQLVYDKAKENLNAFMGRNVLFIENKACYYLYRLIMGGRSQTGLVCVSSVDDYENNLIKKHEFTRPNKELDRINHIKTTGAQTGNVFLTYRNVAELDNIFATVSSKDPLYDFIADDGVQHTVWLIKDEKLIDEITTIFYEKVSTTYIADGHHRAASAAKVRQALGDNASMDSNFFLTTLFPSNQLEILDYNRVVKDLNGLTEEAFIEKLQDRFVVEKKLGQVKPTEPHTFGVYLNKQWYKLTARPGSFKDDVLGVLDVNIMQEHILSPILNIHDQRTDERIDFVGGIRGIDELEKRVDSGDVQLAISIYPVSIEQLLAVSDANEVMPPKSTWFEPKLRDGLLTHLI